MSGPQRCPRCASGTGQAIGRTASSLGFACSREACGHVWLVPVTPPRPEPYPPFPGIDAMHGDEDRS